MHNFQSQPAKKETAYRVVIDELPEPGVVNHANNVQVRMRYVLPLFVYGKDYPKVFLPWLNGQAKAPHQVKWGVVQRKGQAMLYLKNTGDSHIRILDIDVKDAQHQNLFEDKTQSVSYLLSGATAYWPLKISHIHFKQSDQLVVTQPYGVVERFVYLK